MNILTIMTSIIAILSVGFIALSLLAIIIDMVHLVKRRDRISGSIRSELWRMFSKSQKVIFVIAFLYALVYFMPFKPEIPLDSLQTGSVNITYTEINKLQGLEQEIIIVDKSDFELIEEYLSNFWMMRSPSTNIMGNQFYIEGSYYTITIHHYDGYNFKTSSYYLFEDEYKSNGMDTLVENYRLVFDRNEFEAFFEVYSELSGQIITY